MDIRGIDLNLLVVLDALLEERNVSRAARRVGLSQPAASHALRRLRALLDDPLLLREGRSYAPTARALSLQAPLRRMLIHAREVVGSPPPFDPAKAEREFRLLISGSLSSVLLERVLHQVMVTAPGICMHVLPVEREKGLAARQLVDGEVDLAAGAFPEEPRAIHKLLLYEDRVCCLLHRTHPLATGPMTLDRVLGYPHLLVSYYRRPFGPLEAALAQQGKRRVIGAHLPNYALVGNLLAQHDLVATIPERIALELADERPLVVREFPLPLPSLDIYLMWHASVQVDPLHAWVREQFTHAARGLASTRKAAAKR